MDTLCWTFAVEHNVKSVLLFAVVTYLSLSAGLEGTTLCRGSNSSSCCMMDLALTCTPEILMLIPRRFPGPLAGIKTHFIFSLGKHCICEHGYTSKTILPSTGFSLRCSSCSCTAATQLVWISSPSLFRSAIDLSTSSESRAMASNLATEKSNLLCGLWKWSRSKLIAHLLLIKQSNFWLLWFSSVLTFQVEIQISCTP